MGAFAADRWSSAPMLIKQLAFHQECLHPVGVDTAAYNIEGEIDCPEQRPLQLVVAFGGGQLEVVAGY